MSMASTGDDDSNTDSLLEYEIPSDDALSNENAYVKRSDSDIEENGSDFSDGSLDRENRFLGTSNVWRYFTQEERALAASLDQQQANDLSLHLYCAHSLKNRFGDAKPGILRSRKRKADDGEEDSLWCPDATWTAWPVRPQDLPKAGEQFGAPVPDSEPENSSSITYRRGNKRHAGTELEQEVQALMLKGATKRYRESAMAQSGQNREPDSLLDDEKAEEALQPAVQRIRWQVDDLLRRLQNKSKPRTEKGKRAQSRSDSSRSVSRGSTPAISHARRKAPISSEFITDSESDSSDPPASNEDYEHQNNSSSVHQLHRRRPKHLRGWTEVLRAAMVVGLNPTAVQRATDRCAALFGGITALPTSYDCPVTTCSRHGTPFEKAWRFREHLKRSHKMSVKEIYDVEALLHNNDTTGVGLIGASHNLVVIGRDGSL